MAVQRLFKLGALRGCRSAELKGEGGFLPMRHIARLPGSAAQAVGVGIKQSAQGGIHVAWSPISSWGARQQKITSKGYASVGVRDGKITRMDVWNDSAEWILAPEVAKP